ncbi:Dimer_Tnp_hAT domain-containing protein [Senna tora]|uniref:Dimer_Tnp_hAT domain-containing protein n=1 Tax=Senna tora TaxID=362788 RepID=A0A834T6S2_9FABA|nr:Dimer_Tnp_hAT domain-containing protein [Senna tora]
MATKEFIRFSGAEDVFGQFECLQNRWDLEPKEWWIVNKINPKRAEDLVFVHTNLRLLSRQSSKYNKGETRMWDIGGDRAEPFDGAGTLEVSSLSLDEPELEAVIFTDDVQGNNEISTVQV